MMILLALVSLLIGLGLLIWLAVIDLREWILPNEIVLGLAATGLVFHFLTFGSLLDPIQMGLGALAGGGFLYVVRLVANAHYGRDTMGLGDVKLLIAGGLWAGPYYIMLGLAAGAFLGAIIGLIFMALPHSRPEDLEPGEGDGLLQTAVPAGPGFCLGIIVAVIWMIVEWPRLPYALNDAMDVMYGFVSTLG